MDRKLVITCEHAGNDVPAEYRHLFQSNPRVLQTHRGYDIGALELAKTIGEVLSTEVYLHTTSRLLVDLNRSLHNPSAFSEFMNGLDKKDRRRIIEEYYLPHRQKVENIMTDMISQGQAVLHLSVHTFTPQLKGVVRKADIAFLYDPQRSKEKEFCLMWRKHLKKQLRDLAYRMNYPYRGTMDGFATYLRNQFSEDSYHGVELEVNQKFAESDDHQRWLNLQKGIVNSLKEVLEK